MIRWTGVPEDSLNLYEICNRVKIIHEVSVDIESNMNKFYFGVNENKTESTFKLDDTTSLQGIDSWTKNILDCLNRVNNEIRIHLQHNDNDSQSNCRL